MSLDKERKLRMLYSEGYPVLETQFAQFLMLNGTHEIALEESKRLLEMNYKATKKRIERSDMDVFCFLDPPEVIVREINGIYFKDMISVGWKATAFGRAFYIKRLEYRPKKYKMHSHKKNVPKRKRGKRRLKHESNCI